MANFMGYRLPQIHGERKVLHGDLSDEVPMAKMNRRRKRLAALPECGDDRKVHRERGWKKSRRKQYRSS